MSENEYVNKSLTLDGETLRRLQAMAAESDRSISAMARVCINEVYERMMQAKQGGQKQAFSEEITAG